jgi:hypothetical protein
VKERVSGVQVFRLEIGKGAPAKGVTRLRPSRMGKSGDRGSGRGAAPSSPVIPALPRPSGRAGAAAGKVAAALGARPARSEAEISLTAIGRPVGEVAARLGAGGGLSASAKNRAACSMTS